MQRLLFATTALIATAGMAAADVKIGGYGRFGMNYTENAADEVTVASRLRIQFDVSAETQSGIKFGARQRIQTEEGGMGAGNGVRFYMTTGGLTVGAGNIIGTIEGAPGLYLNSASAGVGLEGNGYLSLATNTVAKGSWGWNAYSSGGAGAANGVEIQYSANGLTVYAATSDNEDGVRVSYKFGDYTLAVAATDNIVNTNDKTFVSFGGKLGAADFTLAYADNDGIDKISLKGGTNVGAATYVYGFVADEDSTVGGTSYGLGVSHDLGGASIEAGVTTNDWNNTTQASAGFFFAF